MKILKLMNGASDRIKKMDGTFYNVNFDYGVTLIKETNHFNQHQDIELPLAQSLPILKILLQ